MQLNLLCFFFYNIERAQVLTAAFPTSNQSRDESCTLHFKDTLSNLYLTLFNPNILSNDKIILSKNLTFTSLLTAHFINITADKKIEALPSLQKTRDKLATLPTSSTLALVQMYTVANDRSSHQSAILPLHETRLLLLNPSERMLPALRMVKSRLWVPAYWRTLGGGRGVETALGEILNWSLALQKELQCLLSETSPTLPQAPPPSTQATALLDSLLLDRLSLSFWLSPKHRLFPMPSALFTSLARFVSSLLDLLPCTVPGRQRDPE